jgi:hypothetical protein
VYHSASHLSFALPFCGGEKGGGGFGFWKLAVFPSFLPMECYAAMSFSHDAFSGSSDAESAQSAAVPSPLSFDRFCNDDPNVLTVVVIGGRSHVRAYILRQHTLGVVEAGAWRRLLPFLGAVSGEGNELGESGDGVKGC